MCNKCWASQFLYCHTLNAHIKGVNQWYKSAELHILVNSQWKTGEANKRNIQMPTME